DQDQRRGDGVSEEAGFVAWPSRPFVTWAGRPCYVTFRITSDALCPPKPKLLLIATSTLRSRALCGTKSRSHSGSGLSRLIVGGMRLRDTDMAVMTASTPPLAPSKCPSWLLVELIATLYAWSPKVSLTALVSAM